MFSNEINYILIKMLFFNVQVNNSGFFTSKSTDPLTLFDQGKKWTGIFNYWYSLTSAPAVISSTGLLTCIIKFPREILPC